MCIYITYFSWDKTKLSKWQIIRWKSYNAIFHVWSIYPLSFRQLNTEFVPIVSTLPFSTEILQIVRKYLLGIQTCITSARIVASKDSTVCKILLTTNCFHRNSPDSEIVSKYHLGVQACITSTSNVTSQSFRRMSYLSITSCFTLSFPLKFSKLSASIG